MDEETREFNFWTHQIHIFFIRKVFRANEHMTKLNETRIVLQKEKEVSFVGRGHFGVQSIDDYVLENGDNWI